MKFFFFEFGCCHHKTGSHDKLAALRFQYFKFWLIKNITHWSYHTIFLTSVLPAKKIFVGGTTLCGTMRKNKSDNLGTLLPHHSKEKKSGEENDTKADI